jgi:hypothetical protein
VTPFLSIVLTGRNDQHGGDFRRRFFRTLGFNLHELRERGISHEVVFVEWGPDETKPLLIDLAIEEVSGATSETFHGIVVDGRYQEAMSLNPKLVYLEFVAKNVGIRRARGRFVLATNCDVFLGRHVLDVLQREALVPRTVYRARRHDLKLADDGGTTTWEMLEDPRNLDGEPPALKPPLLAGATGDFVLLDRDTFHDVRGFNEIYRLARIGVDSNFLLKARSARLPIEDIGGPVYHINHAGSYRLSRDVYADHKEDAPWGDIRWHSRGVVYMNPDGWGLGDAPESTVNAWSRRLEFTWDAVPPLVDLRRVVLPIAEAGEPSVGRYMPQSSGR